MIQKKHVIITVFIVVLMLSGCVSDGGPEADNGSDTEASEPLKNDTADSDKNTTGSSGNVSGENASYDGKQHMGCQPGAISKNGTCQVAVSEANADIFSAKDLMPIVSTNTTLGGTPGYLAEPAANGIYPGVLMIHEWWGLNGNIRHMADVLAGHGYTVFAIDLYGGEVASNSSEARRLSGRVRENQSEAVEKMENATRDLRGLSETTGQVASLGWCFGGGESLQLSLSDAELNATVIYYGTVTTNRSKLRHIDPPVLGIFGEKDQVVPLKTVRKFNRTLTELGIKHQIEIYPDAGHAFANPSGESFHPNATKDAWNKTLDFLDRNLKG
ncbi:MAG: dienelactone hydrolase family protein [Halobacteria archaeon]